jgi:TatD DNase family protein
VLLTDTHTHIQMRQFNRDRIPTIERALANGIDRMIVPGVDISTSEAAIELAKDYPDHIYAAAGVHPHDAEGFDDTTLAGIRKLLESPHVVAAGEMGLDYFRNLSPVTDQRRAFEAQVTLARELDLPIIVHNRDAHADIMAILRPYGTVRGIWHCFIGDRQKAEDGLSLGMYLSFAGPVTYPSNTDLAEVASWAPLDRILVETDAPYLTPHPNRRDRNEPANVARVAQRVAEMRGISLEDLAAATNANAAAIFRLPSIMPITGA